jgi:hypothetical protein
MTNSTISCNVRDAKADPPLPPLPGDLAAMDTSRYPVLLRPPPSGRAPGMASAQMRTVERVMASVAKIRTKPGAASA